MNRPAEPLLTAQGLVKEFPVRGGVLGRSLGKIQAVRQVDLQIYPGETLGLVGESGSGKSTLARLLLQLIPYEAGEVWFQGPRLTGLSFGEMIQHRRAMQMIFQDPADSLNSRMTLGQILAEPLEIQGRLGQAAREEKIRSLLPLVGLGPEILHRYPHEFSGGQRQRIGIARALTLDPKLILADEPVSSLDVSIQAQILNLLKDLQQKLGLSFLFIAHDIHVIFFISHRMMVMYLGEVVEAGSKDQLRQGAKHPYTQALLAAVPKLDPAQRHHFSEIQGEIPSLLDPPGGCRFHPRCPKAEERCRMEPPLLRELAPGHKVACHLAN